jgi:hypothetical protein
MKGFSRTPGTDRTSRGSAVVYRKPAGKPTFKGTAAPRPRKKKVLVLTLICDRLFSRREKITAKGRRTTSRDTSRPSFTRVFPEFIGQQIVLAHPFERSLAVLPPNVRAWLITNYYV